jgi:hypothetical protein
MESTKNMGSLAGRYNYVYEYIIDIYIHKDMHIFIYTHTICRFIYDIFIYYSIFIYVGWDGEY